MRTRTMLLTAATCLLAASWLAVPARATLPGTDGAIVFEYESPVPGEQLTQTDLYSVQPDGSALTQLTATPHRMEFAPAWSPDGTRIVFSRTLAPFGHGSIWVIRADGSSPVRLTSGIDARDPAWSPNGRRIAFTRFDGQGGPNIVTMRAADGGGMRRITPWNSLEFSPAWSPDGTTIAFTRGFEQGDVGNIWVIDLSTMDATKLTSSPAYDYGANWSPDGTTIAFERALENTAQVMTIGADGTGLTALTSSHWDADPVYSPTGAAIAFATDRKTFFPDLWVMGAEGSNKHVIVDLPYASTAPDWQRIP
jgi:TolB protein